MVPCVVFVLSSYGVLYFETRRHQKKIKTQQLPLKEKETFIAESKALKTTALVFGALVLCLFPAIFTILLSAVGIQKKKGNFASMVVTFAMLNSLMNPLIYCWRQREMRKFVFRRSPRQATDNDLQT